MSKKAYDASSIVVLEGLDAVRKRPGMYIGSVDYKGMNHMIYEIVDNAIDEYLAGYCSEIKISINKDGSVSVSDNGRGIPIGMHKQGVSAERVVFTVLHAGGKFNNDAYKVSGGLHGVGSSVVNALSEWLTVEVKSGGKIHYDSYAFGKPTTELVNGLLPTKGRVSGTGTTVSFLPDKEIFGKSVFKLESIKNRLHEMAYLNPGLKIYYSNVNKEEEITYFEPDGLVGYIKKINEDKQPLTDVFKFNGSLDGVEVECVMQYINSFDENVFGFCNDIATVEGGTHINGFKNRYTTIVNTYARDLGVLKEKDDNFTGADVRSGLVAIVSVKHPDPLFEGQTKTKLGNTDMTKIMYTITGEQLTLYFDKNVKTIKTILECAEKSAKVRKSELKNKANMLEKQRFTFEGNGKLANCESKDAKECEIFIVEGDSAGGNAKMARDRKTQAIMPIRGKILNVEKATAERIFQNAEIRALITAFGCGMGEGYGNDFDITKLRYDKIVIMTDADVDGAHINTLLLTFLYKFVPELIKQGHVYRAMPPLYKATTSKSETYLYNDEELEKYRKTHKTFELQRYKGLGEQDAEQLWETTMNPKTRFLKRIEIEDAVTASKTTELLMGSDVENRRDFISDNAVYANLDV